MASITDQNWLVWNQGKNPLVNFNFMLRVELLFDLPCKSVRAFTRELEYEFIQEGGLNDYVHMRRKPISKPFVLEVERYVGVDYIDPLPLGADLVLPVLLFVSRNHDQFIPGVVARTYVFTGCTVMKKTYGDLIADKSGLLVETTTIGYREMLCVDIPWSEVGDNISASTPTVPTQAATADKSAQELKAQGQEMYLRAQQAKEQADSEYDAQKAQTLIQEMETNLNSLNEAVAAGGWLSSQVDGARKSAATAAEKKKTLEETSIASQAKEKEKKDALLSVQNDDQKEETADQQPERDAGQEQPDPAKDSAYEKALAEWEEAAAQAKKDKDAAEQAVEAKSQADGAMAEAEQALSRGKKQASRLQNSLTNLKSWKDKGTEAQTACATQHDLCKTANDELQKLPDEPLTEVNSKYEEVKKTHQETVYQEKQVRQAQQYVQAGQEELTAAKEILAAQNQKEDTEGESVG